MEGIPGLLELLQQSGPVGAAVAGVIVGLVLAVILIAHFKGLWNDARAETQTIAFQDKLLALVDKLTASEEALRRRIDEIGRDRDAKQDEIEDLRVQMALLRNQRRRLIDMMRRGFPGALKPRPAP